MKWKIDRIISMATLAASLIAIFLVLKKPQPVAPAQSSAAAAANVQSLENKLEQLEKPKEPGQEPAQVHFSSDEITAALAQAAAALPATIPASAAAMGSAPSAQASPGKFLRNLRAQLVFAGHTGRLHLQDRQRPARQDRR